MADAEVTLTESTDVSDGYSTGEGDISIALNLSNVAPSFYRNFNFNSFCVLEGKCLCAGENGLLGYGGDDDAGSDIDAYIVFPTTDFGTLKQKRVLKIFYGGRSNGTLQATVQLDEGIDRTFDFSPKKDLKVGNQIAYGRRDQKGGFLTLRIGNTAGCDFSLSSLDLTLSGLGKKPGGSDKE